MKSMKTSTILALALALSVGIIGGGVGGYLAANKSNTESTTENNSSSLSTTDNANDTNSNTTVKSTELLEYLSLSDQEVNTYCDEISSAINNLTNNPKYIKVQTGDDIYDLYIYNSKGECFTQTYDNEYTTVFNKEGHSVRVSSDNSTLVVDASLDFAGIIKNSLTALKNKKPGFEMQRIKYNDEDSVNLEGVKECVINITGRDACKEIYTNLAPEIADALISNVESYINELMDSENEGSSDSATDSGADSGTDSGTTKEHYSWNPSLQLDITWKGDELYISFTLILNDGTKLPNWIYDGNVIDCPDWELGQEWYLANFEDNTDDANSKLITMVINTSNELDKRFTDEGFFKESEATTELSSDTSSSISEGKVKEESTQSESAETPLE